MSDPRLVPLYALCLFHFNHSVDANINYGTMTLLMMSCFEMSNIGLLFVFTFWQTLYVIFDEKEQSFPGYSMEVRGRFFFVSLKILDML